MLDETCTSYPSFKSSTLSLLTGDSVCLCCCCASDELVDLFRVRLNRFEPFGKNLTDYMKERVCERFILLLCVPAGGH